MNRGTYGFPLPPNAPTRIAPPEWRSYKLITATTSAEVVPANVWQILVMVWGGGALGGNPQAGGGGGFSMGIIDVVPGQLLPPLTVGGAGSTSSFGPLLSATGGGSLTGGMGNVSPTVRQGFTASGGTGSSFGGGGASGSPYGNGGNGGAATNAGGGGWGGGNAAASGGSGGGGILSPSAGIAGASPGAAVSPPSFSFVDVANRRIPCGTGGVGTTGSADAGQGGPGAGGGGHTTTAGFNAGAGGFGAGGGGDSATGGIGGNGGIGGGGGSGTGAPGGGGLAGGGGGAFGGAGGAGLIVLCWTEGY